MNPQASDSWEAYDRPELRRGRLVIDGDRASAEFAIDGIHCGGCALRIERTLAAIAGVDSVSVNGATHRMRVSWDLAREPLSHLLRAVADLGYTPHLLSDATAGSADRDSQERRTALKRLAVAGIGMAQVMSFAFALYAGAAHGIEANIERYLRLVSLLVSIPVVFYSSAPFFRSAYLDVRQRRPGMDVPVALAIGLAFAASTFNTLRGQGGVYFDSVTMFAFFLLLGRYIELQTRHRRGNLSDALARLIPDTVHRVGDRGVETVPRIEVRVGDRLRALPGAPIAADGRIVAGKTTVDESLLTGESMPLPRKQGDSVIGGSLNLGNPVDIEVTALGSNTVLAHVVRLLARAQAERPRLGKVADKAAGWFVAATLILAVGTAAFWLRFDPARAFAATLAVLVVTCPCALSLATPVAVAAATARLARNGLLITHPDTVEALASVRRCVFDKTGTLTVGAPQLRCATASGSVPLERCLALAAALEQHSEHPLAAAFSATAPLVVAENVRSVRGRGIEGEVNGRRYRIGRPDFVQELAPGYAAIAGGEGGDFFLGDESGTLAAFQVDDSLRPSAVLAIQQLRALNVEVEIASGDGPVPVGRVAKRLGVAAWRARLTPAAKMTHIRSLNHAHGGVMMIGDGINDAPVLGAARISVAMSAGSALAQVSADSVLMSVDLTIIPEAVRMARRTVQVIRQNLAWAAIYNLLAVPLAATAILPPWGAAIGMSASSIIVVLNACRLDRSARACDKSSLGVSSGPVSIPASASST
jgi:Cu2+-exporting ATPase